MAQEKIQLNYGLIQERLRRGQPFLSREVSGNPEGSVLQVFVII